MEQCVQGGRVSVWGWGVGAVSEEKESLEGMEASVQKKVKLALTLKWLGM